MHSILAMEMLMHYHCCVEEFENVQCGAQQDVIRWALAEGLLVARTDKGKYGSSYNTTDRAKALIDAWASTPLPVSVWVIPVNP